MEQPPLPFFPELMRKPHSQRFHMAPIVVAGFVLLCLRAELTLATERAEDKSPAIGQLRRPDRAGDCLPVSALSRLGTSRFRHGRPVFCTSFSHDGKILISGSADRSIRFWETATGNELRRFRGHRGDVVTAILSADGQTLASAGYDQTLRLWDAGSGKQLAWFDLGALSFCRNLAMTPDGKSLITVTEKRPFRNVLRVRELPSGKELRRVYLADYCNGGMVTIAPDGKTLALARDDDVALLDVASGKVLRSFLGHREVVVGNKVESRVTAVAFAGDGRTLASGATDQTVRLWDVATGKQIRCLEGHQGQVEAVAFSSDGKLVASGSQDGSVRLWDARNGQELRRFDLGHGWVHSVCFSPDGKWMAAGCDDHMVHRWDVATGKEVFPGPGHQRAVLGLAYSADSNRVTTAGQDLTLYQWEAATGKERWRGLANQPGITHGCLAPRGSLVAGAGEDGMIYCREGGAKPSVAHAWKGHDALVECLVFSPDAKILATADQDGCIRLWEVATRTLLHEITGQKFQADSLCFSSDGKILASGGSGYTVTLWNVASGQKLLQTAPAGEGGFTCLAFSCDGRNVAAGTYGGFVCLWELASGTERCHFRGQEGPQLEIPPQRGYEGDIRAIAFSPDGKILAWGGGDRLVHLWDFTNGKDLRRFAGHQGYVTSLSFSPDGKALASGSYDTTGLVWDLSGLQTGSSARRTNGALADPEGLWSTLGDADASKGFRAIQTMIQAPKPALSFIKKQVRPAPPVDTRQISRLVFQLDDPEFKRRTDAEKELVKFGELAEPQLRRALTEQATAELRRRGERLLARLEGPKTNPDQLRAIRVVEILEHIGSAEARALLATLAHGASEALLTREAKQAVGRLHRLPPRQ